MGALPHPSPRKHPRPGGCRGGNATHFTSLTDITQPKSIVFPFFGSLVSDTLIDDNIWMLGNSVYCFKVANDLYTLALGDDFKLVKNFVKENFFEPLIRIKK